MDQWTPDEVEAHIAFMGQVADELKANGEFVDEGALSPGAPSCGTTVKDAHLSDDVRGDQGPDRGLDGDRRRLATTRLQAAARLSAAPGPGGTPICEWIEVRPFYGHVPTVTE